MGKRQFRGAAFQVIQVAEIHGGPVVTILNVLVVPSTHPLPKLASPRQREGQAGQSARYVNA
jgi:hypothetical protein